ncbi:MAG: alpha/beta hydrolase [Bacteroidota bacterium]
MTIYGISGLGADERVFEYLELDDELIPIRWIKPNRKESLANYAKRLAQKINQEEPYGILGVSFGGIVAVEISKYLNPQITILISSAETKHELRMVYRLVGKLSVIPLLPTFLFDPPRKLASFLFGTQKRNLLNAILDDTDLNFAKWAINQLTLWNNEETLNNCLKISGKSDKLIPPNIDDKTVLIDEGEHFMIVDKAKEIGEIINQKLRTIN